jgi:protoheme IX farnesyltransferase
VLTLIGGTLAAGANTINCYIDRDIDGMLAPHAARPQARWSRSEALLFGLSLGAASFVF